MSDTTAITEHALSLGFSTVGFCKAFLPLSAQERLQEFLASGHHGEMQWMEERSHLRTNPQNLWPDAKSVIVLGHNYAPEQNPLELLSQPHIGAISAYARNIDYHDVIKKKLKTLARWMVEHYGGDVKVFVDTAPIMEKPLAEQAGIGWQGKHTCLVSKEFGSWLFLGSIFTTLELASTPTTEKERFQHCGTCNKCITICPTDAFTEPGKLDARKCIAYLTIEHKSHIPDEYLELIGNRIYGCDDCLSICPWNKFAKTAEETAYHARQELASPSLYELAQLDDAAFRTLFRGSPIKRIGRERFIRNVLIAIGNTKDAIYQPVIQPLLNDPSVLVQKMAERAARLCVT